MDIATFFEKKEIWYPILPAGGQIAKGVYKNREKKGDAIFEVDGRHFHPHHTNVLDIRAPTLVEMAEDSNDGAPIPIEDVDRRSFEVVLQWIYTVMDLDQIEEVWNDFSSVEKLLLAADRCECTDLKLYAESVLADKYLTIERAAKFLVIADGHSCALLKEAAMKLYTGHSLEVKKSDGWSLVEQSNPLLNEFLDCYIQP